MQRRPSNWQRLHNEMDGPGRAMLMRIPEDDLNRMTLPEARAYVMAQMKPRGPPPGFTGQGPANPLGFTNAENMLKYDMHPNSEDPTKRTLAYKQNEKIFNAADGNDMAAMTRLIARTGVDMLRTLEHLPRYLEPATTYESTYLARRNILLDSRNRELSSDNYTWNLSPHSSAQRGTVNSKETITSIVEVSASAFTIPIIPGQNMQYYRRVRVGIVEFASQGIEIALNNQYSKKYNYHFEFNVSQSRPGYLELTPLAPWRPGRPIAQCSSITLQFFGNSELIIFPHDYMLCTYVTGTPTTMFTAPSAHGLHTGDLVYIETGEFYNDQGYIVAVWSPTTFSIKMPNLGGGTAYVFFASRRVQVQLNFTCLEVAN